MANIADYLRQIQEASNGNLARKPIIGALNAINTNGPDANSLDGHDAIEYMSHEELKGALENYQLDIDETLTPGSQNPASSKALYAYFGSNDFIDFNTDSPTPVPPNEP